MILENMACTWGCETAKMVALGTRHACILVVLLALRTVTLAVVAVTSLDSRQLDNLHIALMSWCATSSE
jgi:hypothetical protein